jgi:hypothetical protein
MSYNYNEPSDAKLFGIGAAWVVATLLLVGAIGVAVWYFGVATSGVHGKGEVIKRNNSADNRVFQQEHFQTVFGDVKADKLKIKFARESLASDTKGTDTYDRDKINLEGLQQLCVTAVEDYNADANKVTARDWRDPSLPKTLDATNYCS